MFVKMEFEMVVEMSDFGSPELKKGIYKRFVYMCVCSAIEITILSIFTEFATNINKLGQ